ncbi:MAG: DUF928 domain-containing protein, partial [Leptolyngbyaceae bacterium]|nr:DUF928 domain-containing protein [Leptolyngbyaceae bacterium]
MTNFYQNQPLGYTPDKTLTPMKHINPRNCQLFMIRPSQSRNSRRWFNGIFLSLAILSPLFIAPRVEAAFAERVETMFTGAGDASAVIGQSEGGVVKGETCNLFNRLRRDASSQDRFRALVPTTNLTTTVSPYPAFWFYLPVDNVATDRATALEFDVQDETGRSLLPGGGMQADIPTEPSIVGFRLPDTAEPLQVGRQYTWFLTLDCDTANAVDNPFVYGQVERISVADDLIVELATAPPGGKFMAYAESLVWQETVTELAQNAGAYSRDWTALLEMFDLGAIAPDIPIQEFSFPSTDVASMPLTFPASDTIAIGRSRVGVGQQNACNFYDQARLDAASDESLIAFIPGSNQGSTVLPYPTFWFYLPLAQTREAMVQYLEFELYDEAGASVLAGNPLRTTLPEQPGLVGLTLPNQIAPLQVGQQYTWSLTLVCDTANKAANPFVYGAIERRAATEELTYQLETTPAHMRYGVFAQNQIWYDMVNQLVQQRQAQPQPWSEL